MQGKLYREAFPELVDKLILNVDDSEMNQLVIKKIMENAGMKTIAVSNGAEAIEKLKEGMKPDFILMDLDMPVMNGLQTSEFIVKNKIAGIPIIINSGAVSELQKWKLKRLGITDFLEKPYSMDDIFAILAKKIPILHD